MGGLVSLLSRRNGGVEEVEIAASHAYRYPPKSGCYFGSHFIMGGEKFETTQPESYLFGENTDLNFLGNRPAPFPYPAPQAHEPTKTLKSLVNIRKDSIRFVKVVDNVESEVNEESGEREDEARMYNIEFTFDSDVRVAITIYYFAAVEVSNGQANYQPRDSSMNSETYHYKRGANQTFSQSTHVLYPSKFAEEDWQYHPDKEVIPVVIQCVVEEEQYNGHSHASYATVDKSSDGGHVLKALKQKQMVDGLYYLLQEIYGIENRSPERQKLDDEFEDNGSECVICMCEMRDTLILPCRHLCLCNFCADNLRFQANNCPICRAPFRALLQIRAMRKKITNTPPLQQADDDNAVSQEGVPSGFEAVPLIEALNGPQNQPNTQPIMPPVTLTMPPDDSTGNSPALKRKHRRSTKANKPSRRSTKDDNKIVTTATSPTQVGTEGAMAMVAMPPQVKNLVETPEAESDITSVKLDMEVGETTTDNDVTYTDDVTHTEVTTSFEPIAKKETEQTETETSTVALPDDTAADCTDYEQDDNQAEEQTPLCGDVTSEELDTRLNESELKCCGDNLDFNDTPLKPSADSSSSSYSSTSSSKGLLENVPQPVVDMNPKPED